MNVHKVRSLVLCLLFMALASHSFSQQKSNPLVCRERAFAAMKPLPELTYPCPDDIPNESDDRILKHPERTRVRNAVIKTLESFTDPRWWATTVRDLNICHMHEMPGKLSDEEVEEFTGPEYQVELMGDARIRLVILPDSCYQTYYNGANAYLLYRKGGKVYVTEVLDGYYSRLAKSISLKVYRANQQQRIEIQTVNISGMRPETSSFTFVIDSLTNKAVLQRETSKGGRRVR